MRSEVAAFGILLLANLLSPTEGLENDDAPRFASQASMNCSFSSGVCSTGTWAMYYGGKDDAACKQVCDTHRTLIPVPTGVLEKVYKFKQNGQFHDVSGRTPLFERGVPEIWYPSTGSAFDETFKANGNLRDHFYIRWEGYVKIDTEGDYTFYTRSDDGSRLYINDKQIVDNPGWHGMRTKEGTVTLTKGKHAFWAEVFEGGGGAGMEVHYKGPDSGNQKVKLPSSVLSGSLVDSQELMLPPSLLDGGTYGLCVAYSSNGQGDCIIYSECGEVGPSEVCDNSGEDGACHKQVCQDKSFKWVKNIDFNTCRYEDPTPSPVPVEEAPTEAPQAAAAPPQAAGMSRDEANDGKKCKYGGPNRVFDLRNSDASEDACIKKCEEVDKCVAFSGIFGHWCIGCSVALDDNHKNTIAYKKADETAVQASAAGKAGECGGDEAKLNDFSSRASMEIAGWSLDWDDKYDFKPAGSFQGTTADASYWGFKYPGAGTISLTLKGQGSVTLGFGNPWKGGDIKVFLNDDKKADSQKKNTDQSVTMDFKNGDVLKIREDKEGIIAINSIKFKCN
jgi:hypothetical protein